MNQRTDDSKSGETFSSPHTPTCYVGLCHRCYTSGTAVSVSKFDEILCEKCLNQSKNRINGYGHNHMNDLHDRGIL